MSSILHRLQEFIEKHSSDQVFPDVYILGDLNCPGINWSTHFSSDSRESELLEFGDKYFLSQVVHEPTRGENTLDIILTNREEYCASVGVEDLNISDHSVVQCVLGFGLDPVRGRPARNMQGFAGLDIHSADFEAVNTELQSVDWDGVLEDYCKDGDGSDIVKRISDVVLQIVSRYARAKRHGIARKDPMLKRLKKKQKKLNQKIFRAKKANSYAGHVAKLERRVARVALEIRYHLNRRLDQEEQRAVDIIRSNPKFFWTYTNDRRKTKSRIPPLKRVDGTLAQDPGEKAELLQEQYLSVFSDPGQVVVEDAVGSISFAGPTLSDIEFNPSSIEAALKLLDPFSAGPPGDIPSCILNRCRSALSYPLFLLWRDSFNRGVIPSCLKRQFITPIFKKGSRSEVGNYRPVSLTSNIIKCFERVVRAGLITHFETSGILNDSQHGFRRNRSCLTQLIEHLDRVLRAVSDGDEVDVIYLDYQKAFDKVDHRVLVSKLEKYGVSGKLLEWIRNFLQDRVQAVTVDQVFSDFKEVLSGVPQGSVLGPVLFLVYVIDLESSLKFSDALTFADDTKIIKVIRGILDHANLQEDLCNVVDWSVLNNMTLHDDKFELVRYSPRSNILMRELPFTAGYLSYETPSGVCLTSSPVVKDLGVLLSEDGSWKPQIEKVSASASRVANWILGRSNADQLRL